MVVGEATVLIVTKMTCFALVPESEVENYVSKVISETTRDSGVRAGSNDVERYFRRVHVVKRSK